MNLGELFISITADSSVIDKVSSSLEELIDVAKQVSDQLSDVEHAINSLETSTVAELATGFSKASDSGEQAASATRNLAKELEEAVFKGNLFADAMEKAFQTVIDLAKQAASAVSDFVSSSVDQYASYEQNLESMNRTFGNYSGEFQSWMQENATKFGMSMNEMMEHANKTGIIIQKDSAQRRAAEQASEEETTEAQSREIDARLANFKAGLAEQEAAMSESHANQYAEAKEYYDGIYDALKQELDDELSALKRRNEEVYNERKRALDREYDALKEQLDKAYEETKKNYDRIIDNTSRQNELEYNARKRTLELTYDALKKELDDEVDAYQMATDARIKEIDREYTERMKLLDEEKYNELKAIQDKIDALDEQGKMEERSARDRQDAEKVANLQQAIATAVFIEDKEKAAKQLAELELSIQERKNKEQRSDQKAAYKKEMDAVKEHYSKRKEDLKQEHKDEIDEYKQSRKIGLDNLKESNAERLSELKRAQQDELYALKDSQKRQLDELRESRTTALSDLKDHNQKVLKNKKEENEQELRELKQSNTDQENALKRSNEARLKEQKSYNDAKLRELRSAQSAELRELKTHNSQLLAEEQKLATERKKALSGGGQYAEITDQDQSDSVKTLQKLFETAADVAAARNMSTNDVLNIFESMNYGRFATFDNLGLGYANKTGIQQMVADMGKQMGKQLDPENFNDVAMALGQLVQNYHMSGQAAKESVRTVSGSMNALKATWENFKLAIATQGTEDDDYVLHQLFYGTGKNGDEGTVMNFLNNLIPVVETILSGIVRFIKERGPEIFDRVWTTLLKSLPPEWAEELEKLGDSLKKLVDIIAKMMPTPSDFIDKIADLLEKFNNLADAANKLKGTEGLGGIASIIGDVATALGTLWTIGKIKDAVDLFKGLKDAAFGAAGKEGLGGLGQVIGNVIGGGGGAAGGGAAAAGGGTAAGGAAAAGGGGLAGLKAAASTAGSTIASVLGPAAIAGGAMAGVGLLTNAILESTGSIDRFHKSVEDGTYNATAQFTHMGDAAVESHQKAAEAYGGAAIEIDASASAAAKSVADSAASMAESTKTQSEETGNWTEAVKGFFDGMSETTTTTTGEMKNKWLTDLDSINTGVQVNTASMSSSWATSMDNMKQGTTTAVSDVKVQTAGMLTDVKTSFEGTGTTLVDPGAELIKGFESGAKTAWSTAQDFFGGILNWIVQHKGPLDKDRQALVPAGKAVMQGFKEGASGSEWSAVQTFFSGISGSIGSFFKGAGTWLTSSGSSLINGMQSGVSSTWQSASNTISNLPKYITDYFSQASSWLYNGGINIVVGLINGINSKVQGIWDALSNGISGAVDNFRRFLGIASPSKLFRKFGEYTGEGYEEGVEDAFDNDVIPYILSAMDEIDGKDISPSLRFSEMFDDAKKEMNEIRASFKDMTNDMLEMWKRSTDEMLNVTRDFGARNSSAVSQSSFANNVLTGMTYKNGGSREVEEPVDSIVVLEVDGVQFGKAVYKTYNNENRRIGARLAGLN